MTWLSMLAYTRTRLYLVCFTEEETIKHSVCILCYTKLSNATSIT